MKTNKVTKLGISLLSVAVLGVVAPALTDTPIFGATIVKAEEMGTLQPLKYRIRYHIGGGQEIAPPKTGVINPGESINIYKDIDGYEIVTHPDWMPGYLMTHEIANTYFYGASDGYVEMYLKYKKKETPAPTPTPTPDPEVKPAPKPSDTSKPEVKPELKPQTNSNTAPQAPVKPVGQDSNTKADKPVSKPETTALPNTGEQNSILGFAGFLLASLGLAGLTYKGRH